MHAHSLAAEAQQLLPAWWRIMTRPTQDTFERAAQEISLHTALVGLVLAEAVETVVRRAWLAAPPPAAGPTPPEMIPDVLLRHPLIVTLWPFLFSLLGIGLFSFYVFIAGLLVSGKGRFRNYLHLFALFGAPLLLLDLVLDLIPRLPTWVSTAVFGVYGLVLAVQALRAIHDYTVLKALLTIVVSIVVAIVMNFVLGLAVIGPLVQLSKVVFQ